MPANSKIDRPHRINARLSDVEYAILTAEMQRTGLDLSDVLRLALRAYVDAVRVRGVSREASSSPRGRR